MPQNNTPLPKQQSVQSLHDSDSHRNDDTNLGCLVGSVDYLENDVLQNWWMKM